MKSCFPIVIARPARSLASSRSPSPSFAPLASRLASRSRHSSARDRSIDRYMFPTSVRKPSPGPAPDASESDERAASPAPSEPSARTSDDERVERDYDEGAAESAREKYRLQGKAGCDRVLEALRREKESVKETRQYLFGRLLNLQLEEAVLRDHLNATVNAASDAAREGNGGSGREVEARETESGAET
jgi:hypothetical protein